jgi:hypothetical protein
MAKKPKKGDFKIVSDARGLPQVLVFDGKKWKRVVAK